MAEYIKREDAIDAVLDVYYNTPDIDLSGERLEAAILNIPAADVATVRHGHWNTINQITTGLPWKYRCSDCGCPQEYTHNYFPNCGAKMA